MTYTIVTVAHAADYGLLELQARSMALYCPPGLAHEILIVENFDANAAINWRPTLLLAYGRLAAKVRFVPAADVAPMAPTIGGWWRQQVIKLAIAKQITSERYLVLDAKNHLFKPLALDFLESESGKPKLNGYGYSNHSLKPALIRTLGYFAIEATPYIAHFVRTSTPFVMLSAVSRELVRYIESRERKPFAEAFLDGHLTEFFLYAAFLESDGLLQSTYEMTQPFCADIWVHSATEAGCRDALARAAKPWSGPFLAVHPGAWLAMEPRARHLVAEFWHAAGLFPSVDAAEHTRMTTRAA